MKALFFKISALFTIVCSMNLLANDAGITLYAEDGWPPYSYADGSGISNQKVIEAFALEGVKVNIQVLPFARILNLLKTGNAILGVNVAKTDETKEQFLFHKSPLYTVKSHFYYWHNKPLIVGTKEELNKNTRIGAIIGYDYGDFIDKNEVGLKIERVKNHEQNLKKLSSHRLDALILFDDIAGELITTNNLENKLIKGPPGDSIEIFVAFSKVHPSSLKYLEILNRGLTKLDNQ